MRLFCKTLVIITLLSLLFYNDVNAKSQKKIRVDSISLKGVSAFSQRRLSKVIITRQSKMFRSFTYNEEILLDDLNALVLFYQQNGYLEASVTNYDVKIDSSSFKAQIDITIAEGELTNVEGVSVFGNSVFPDSLLLQKITIRGGDPFLRTRIDNSTVNLLTFYADNGYLDAEVAPVIRINTETHRVIVDFNITERYPFVVGEIKLQGLEKTKKEVVMRELIFNPQELINYSTLLKSQRNIYLTGLFQSVFVRPQPSSSSDSTKKDILIEMKEEMTSEFNVAFGYGSIDRARSKIEIYNNNLRGTSLKLGLTGKVSFIQRAIETSFTNPWTFGIPIRTDLNLLLEHKDEPGYTFNRVGGKIIVGRNFNNKNIIFTILNERTKLSRIRISNIKQDPKSNTRSAKLLFNKDTRDNLFNSTKGYYLESSGEFGWFITERNRKFIRFNGQCKYFYPLNPLTIIGTSISLGLMDSEGGLPFIPLHERFYTGGPNSLRGFEYEKAGPLDVKRVPIGGKIKFIWNLMEIRRNIYKMFGGVVFIEIGNVWLTWKDVNLQKLRSDVGVGLRVKTPIGLGRLDYGITVDRKKDEPHGQLYFSMGQAF